MNPNKPKYTKNQALKILNLNNHASLKEIKLQFKMLARKYHPDTTSFDKKIAEKMFLEINEAYNLLIEYSNKKSRLEKFFSSYVNYEREVLFSQLEAIKFFQDIISKIEASENINLNIDLNKFKYEYNKGYYFPNNMSFRFFLTTLKHIYSTKFGLNAYNVFFNSLINQYSLMIVFYRDNNDKVMSHIYQLLYNECNQFNQPLINFNFSNIFDFQFTSKKRKVKIENSDNTFHDLNLYSKITSKINTLLEKNKFTKKIYQKVNNSKLFSNLKTSANNTFTFLGKSYFFVSTSSKNIANKIIQNSKLKHASKKSWGFLKKRFDKILKNYKQY